MLTRRNLLKGAAASVPVAMGGLARWPTAAQAQAGTKTFVLAHGSWHGGWCWKKVAERLRAKGHAVYTPSYTGMGDRAHLLSKDITINTFAEDLVQVIQSEELSQGHSCRPQLRGSPNLRGGRPRSRKDRASCLSRLSPRRERKECLFILPARRGGGAHQGG